MILLIAGASHTGKTVLAQRLLEKYNYPYLSIDLLKMGLIRSGNTGLTPEQDEALQAYLWPIVKEMIRQPLKTAKTSSSKAATFPLTGKKIFLIATWNKYATIAL